MEYAFHIYNKLAKDGVIMATNQLLNAQSNSKYQKMTGAGTSSRAISGLKYKAENISLNNSFPLGVSNSFLDCDAKISVHNGTLMIIWYVADDKNINVDELFNCF